MTSSFQIIRPQIQTSPVVISSPHSGRAYLPAFLRQSVLDVTVVRSSEDAFVDDLVASAPSLGAPLLLAHVPRAFVDLNRAPDEFDPALIDGARRNDSNPRIASGLGVIPRVVAGGRAIYSGKLPLTEAEARISAHWRPYHAALRGLMDETAARFGMAILLDMHSMPSEAAQMLRPHQRAADVVLGDRHGASADGHIMAEVEAAFTAQGLRTARNSPFAGAYIAQHYGRPFAGKHVVQIEIARGLYMDETQVIPLPHFSAFAATITAALRQVTARFAPPQSLAAE